MIKKSQLIAENNKLKRQVYIWENIGIGVNASVKEKEMAAKKFIESYSEFSFHCHYSLI